MSIREIVRDLASKLVAGEVTDTFDRYYAHNVMISENGAGVLVGKAANENYYSFVNGDFLAGAKLLQITIQGNRAKLDWARGGVYFTTEQVWNGGRVIRENYSYSVDRETPEPSAA